MVRDRTARARIRDHLLTAGPVRATSGYATNALKDAIGYEGSSVAFIQLIAAMARDGEIERDVHGKRTYQISAGPRASSPPAGTASPESLIEAVPPEIDYQHLARALVREIWEAAEATPGVAAEAAQLAGERDEYIRRLQEARSRIDSLLDDSLAANAPSECR